MEHEHTNEQAVDWVGPNAVAAGVETIIRAASEK